ncbi:MAG: thioredoxin [Ardenticatenaceae bacterium]|nr:thioredoxin [Ardenticatenaceae bacterium]MCB9442839.1 thioredoxin [Ardenticatenaceae bacterium]
MATPLAVTDETFQTEIIESDKPALVDFWADWCGPCRMIAPSVKEIAAEYGDSLKVAKVDVDENPAIPGRYGIVGIPTLMLFKDGQVVERIVGAMPKDRILAQILPHLQTAAA